MRKEAVIATIVGLVFGLIITFGFYQAKTALTQPTDKPSTPNQVEPTPTSKNGQQLVLSSPHDETVQEEKTVQVTGTTLPNSFVIVFLENDENIINADESGSFSLDLELKVGSNIITVISLDEDGNSVQEERTVIVTKDSLDTIFGENNPPETTQADQTEN